MATPEELQSNHRSKIYGAAKNANAYRELFGGDAGNYILGHIAGKNFVFDTTVAKSAGGGVDINQTLINEGKRQLALDILKAVHKKNIDWIRKQIEAHNEEMESRYTQGT